MPTLEDFLQHGSPTASLDLRLQAIEKDGAKALAASPHLASLHTLDLDGNDLGSVGFKALVTCPHLQKLHTLSAGGNGIQNSGAKALAQSPHLPNLRHLHLWLNGIQDTGAASFARSPHLSRLESLHLSGNRITDQGILALTRSPFLPALRTLTLDGNPITSKSEDSFAQRTLVKAAPLATFEAQEQEADWRLLGYACLPPQAQASVNTAFLALAKHLHTSEPEGVGWRWCLRHLLTWTGLPLGQAVAAFPALPELQTRLAALEAERTRLEAALF